MKTLKYIAAPFFLAYTPLALADLYQGFYLGVGGGWGWLDNGATNSPGDLGYEAVYMDENMDENVESIIEGDYLAQRDLKSETGGAARVHAGMLWPIYNEDIRAAKQDNFFANAQWGFELGYRYMQVDESHTTLIPFTEMMGCYQQKTSHDVTTQAIDLQGVIRLPVTGEQQWWGAVALIAKGGIAYNMTEIDTRIQFADQTESLDDFNRNIKFSESHDEWLPVISLAAEYMFLPFLGVSLEYSTIFSSDDNANNELFVANLVYRALN